MQNRKEILLVVNPISANKDKSGIIELVQKKTELEEKELIIFKTSGENDKHKIQGFLKSENLERVIAVGGDGTIKLVAENLENREIPIAVVPAGSANALAFNLNIPQNDEEAVKVAFQDNFKTIDSIEIENELCLHMSDFGLNAALIRNYETSKIRGKIGYLMQSIPTLFKSDYPYKFEIKTPEETFKQEGVLLVIANAQKYGTGANVNPKGKIDDENFELLIFKSLNPAEIVKTLRNEANVDPDFLRTISVKEAELFCENPVPFQIDGEFRGERERASVKISKKRFKIVIPSENKFRNT